MVRHYKIHTNIDGSDNKILDMTSGKIRFYQPSDLGLTVNTNVWNSHGIGIFGDSTINHPSIEFSLETFGSTLEENYKIFNEFINLLLSQKYITLEYTTEIGSYFSDIKLSKISKKEGYGFNGTFSETISFDVVAMWYTYEQLKFTKFKNPEFNDRTKIYTNSRYTYTDSAYVYTTEDNIERFSKWLIEENIFSFVARIIPSNSTEKKFGVRFLDENANEYTSIIFNMANKPDYIQLNTDANDEYYQSVTNGVAVNMFSALDFQKFRTRIFKKGTMELVNLESIEINVKRKVDFV